MIHITLFSVTLISEILNGEKDESLYGMPMPEELETVDGDSLDLDETMKY